MRIIETKVYKFDELSQEAQEKAIENLWDINTNYHWWDCVYYDATEIGKILGIDIDKIYFSGFWSQGDGACFEACYSYQKKAHKKIRDYAPKDEKLHNIADRLFDLQRDNFYGLSADVKHSGHYYHEMCTDISIYKHGYAHELQWYGNEYQAVGYTAEHLREALRDFMKWIYRSLEREYDYLTSKEAIIETIEANEYEFTETGELV